MLSDHRARSLGVPGSLVLTAGMTLCALAALFAPPQSASAAVVDRGRFGPASQPVAAPAASQGGGRITADNHPLKQMLAPKEPDPRTKPKMVPGEVVLRLLAITLDGPGSGDSPVPVSLERISLNEGTLATQLYCDVNNDGGVDVVDLLYFVDSFGLYDGEPGYELACDFNDDGLVDVVDLLTLVENWPW